MVTWHVHAVHLWRFLLAGGKGKAGHYTVAGLDHTGKCDRPTGDEKGGVWTYVTDDLNWADLPDTGYLHQHKKINSILLICFYFAMCLFLEHCAVHADVLASPKYKLHLIHCVCAENQPLLTQQNSQNKTTYKSFQPLAHLAYRTSQNVEFSGI